MTTPDEDARRRAQQLVRDWHEDDDSALADLEAYVAAALLEAEKRGEARSDVALSNALSELRNTNTRTEAVVKGILERALDGRRPTTIVPDPRADELLLGLFNEYGPQPPEAGEAPTQQLSAETRAYIDEMTRAWPAEPMPAAGACSLNCGTHSCCKGSCAREAGHFGACDCTNSTDALKPRTEGT